MTILDPVEPQRLRLFARAADLNRMQVSLTTPGELIAKSSHIVISLHTVGFDGNPRVLGGGADRVKGRPQLAQVYSTGRQS